MAYEWDLAVGDYLSRDEQMSRFGGAKYGGMEPSATTPNLFLYSDPSRGETYGYNFDGWEPDGEAFFYTGEGRRGDQLLREGNLALLEHKARGNALRLFVADGLIPGTAAKNHVYVGQFELDGFPGYVTETALDESQSEPRTVFVFRLRPVGAVLRRPQDQSEVADVTQEALATLVGLEVDEKSSFETPGSPPVTATKREGQLVKRYEKSLLAQGHEVARWKLGSSELSVVGSASASTGCGEEYA